MTELEFLLHQVEDPSELKSAVIVRFSEQLVQIGPDYRTRGFCVRSRPLERRQDHDERQQSRNVQPRRSHREASTPPSPCSVLTLTHAVEP